MICQDYFWHLFCLFFFSNTCRIAVFLTSGTHFFLFCQKLSRIRNAGSPKPCSFEKREIPAQSTTARITCVLSATNSSWDHIILNLVEKLVLLSWHTNANLYTPAIRTNHSYDMFSFFFIEKRTCFFSLPTNLKRSHADFGFRFIIHTYSPENSCPSWQKKTLIDTW